MAQSDIQLRREEGERGREWQGEQKKKEIAYETNRIKSPKILKTDFPAKKNVLTLRWREKGRQGGKRG